MPLLLDQRVALQHRFEPLTRGAGTVLEFGEFGKVTGDLPLVPRRQDDSTSEKYLYRVARPMPLSSAIRHATLRGTKAIVIKFDKETCRPCPVRDQCTRSKTGGRTLCLQPRELQEVLDHARLQQADE